MSVTAISKYDFPVRDVRENFPNPLLYVGWEDHLLFCSPVTLPLPEDTLFGDLIEKVLPEIYDAHPDFKQINWDTVQWFNSGQPWFPDTKKSLKENGLGHKSVIRFRTPGLTGIKGSFS